MIKDLLKRIIYPILFDTIPIIVIIILSAIYVEFIPQHWGKLTLITVFIVGWIACKLMPDKYM
ncbi:hypothetical protein PMPD1_1598 [Paramixta manurensis]|uniref:Uncharacterized protein n=1 Tax=Paramixta manurensis TaxID=2740817 RepID=A0A6M8UA36_9GAMM|nr:hypothetical protein PMPD1_1598 [Erwiniaceae bacterium PD-1]